MPSGIGNILFDGQSEIADSFDVFNTQQVRSQIFNFDTATFLNDLDNTLQGFNNSDDVINAKGGNDILLGRSGNDLLRGENGDDILLDGGAGTDTINDFQLKFDKLLLAEGLEFEDLAITGGRNQTEISLSETEEILATLIDVSADSLTMSSFL